MSEFGDKDYTLFYTVCLVCGIYSFFIHSFKAFFRAELRVSCNPQGGQICKCSVFSETSEGGLRILHMFEVKFLALPVNNSVYLCEHLLFDDGQDF